MSDQICIVYKKPDNLKENQQNSRTHSKKQIRQIAKSIERLGFNNPVLLSKDDTIIAGHGRVKAALELKLESIPCIYLEHLSDEEIRAYIIADNKLAENAGWDKEILKIELDYLMNLDSSFDFDATITGFELPEIDLIVNPEALESVKKSKEVDDFLEINENIPKRVKFGDLWQLGEHRVLCGDSLVASNYEHLLEGDKAQVVFTDPPYNVKIKGNVTTSRHHNEFAQASGEMSKEQFIEFLSKFMELASKNSIDGSIHFLFMDFRHIEEMMIAGNKHYSELKNLCVWNKGVGSMGSFYRSQHELVFVFKNGNSPHINNIELGKHGRYRTNVWDYPGMNATNPQAKVLTKLHPTVKPVALIMDALLDCSAVNGIVLDCFGGSGSTLIAAERTKRRARLIELEPRFVDVIIYRWERLTNNVAKLIKKESDRSNKTNKEE